MENMINFPKFWQAKTSFSISLQELRKEKNNMSLYKKKHHVDCRMSLYNAMLLQNVVLILGTQEKPSIQVEIKVLMSNSCEQNT